MSSASEVYTDLHGDSNTKSIFSKFIYDQSSKTGGLAKVLESGKTHPLKNMINDVRSFKSSAEIANMRMVGQASGRAYTEAMRQVWTREKDLAAYLDYKFTTQGCDCSAYIPVVAGGKVSKPAST